MEPGTQIREIASGTLGVIERGNNANGYYCNFGTRKNWKRPNEIAIAVAGESYAPPAQSTAKGAAMSKYATLPKNFCEPTRPSAQSINKIFPQQQQQQQSQTFSTSQRTTTTAPVQQQQQQYQPQQQQQTAPISGTQSRTFAPVSVLPNANGFASRSGTNSSVRPAAVQLQQSPVPVQAPPTVVPLPPMGIAQVFSQKDMWHIGFNELVLEDVIGTGKYGEVSLGTYLGCPVAIKRILECNDETNVMIERELQILKEVRHPNIVQFLGATKHNDEIYIITEYMKKGDLFDALIFGDTPLTWRIKLGIALDIAQACNYLQARGILHRDLKSQNILLSDNNRAKLCDLGLARVFEDQVNKRLTFVGSDRWMAPEIFMGVDYDYKVDVFSYGIVLVELITNQVPDERRPQKMFAFETQAFLSKVPPDCPPAFAKLTVACTSTDPRSRPTFSKIHDIVKAIYESLPEDDE
ncbi:hypothetical protein SAMD00019534_064990 [Acytostelium subglobosum LB1]|uniref:hypothetical protein n=1 Tax=Acytostelium subglobosum LB1 TaxID=1410327 RepID=UPI000644E019|nr:hypothetical protein SAMD00019534_064990 [Acytostelium subglobosum LB1]GAM23324.1 hypothetical protein SAMD00019534_064990 [Acytostelium subglobosum LB1]|eukprot:XP_012753773.1 hypothetical protein SAMD00019534_064990 [Acytostelium subglobosum LB1]